MRHFKSFRRKKDVPPRAEEITIPADVTPDRVPTYIVDFSTQEQTEDVLIEEIQKANVICLVYAVNDDLTIEQLKKYWLPIIRRTLGEQGIPVILVGNKHDEDENSLIEKVLPLMKTFPEIETCIECSAKNLKNLSEVFYYAQKSVLYPTLSIYSTNIRELTPKCIQALKRIFVLFDKDNDDLLNESEINEFQDYCFNIPLHEESLDEVFIIVKKNVSDGIFNNSLTLNGFIYLHKLFIQRGRQETTWTVLRKFGYDDDLNLYPAYLTPNIKLPYGSTFEFSKTGIDFLNFLFTKYDQDQDDALSPLELKNLFSISFDDKGRSLLLSSTTPTMLGNRSVSRFTESSLIDDSSFVKPSPSSSYYLNSSSTTTQDPSAIIELSSDNNSKPSTTLDYWNYRTIANTLVEINERGWLTREGFIQYWRLLLLIDRQIVFEYLAILGYPIYDDDGNEDSNQLSAVQMTQVKNMGRCNKFSTRTIFHCDIIGAPGCGKTTFIRGMLNKGIEEQSLISSEEIAVASSYAIKKFNLFSQQKHLVLHEVRLEEFATKIAMRRHYCDCVCLIYDPSRPQSFTTSSKILKKYYLANKIPALLIGIQPPQQRYDSSESPLGMNINADLSTTQPLQDGSGEPNADDSFQTTLSDNHNNSLDQTFSHGGDSGKICSSARFITKQSSSSVDSCRPAPDQRLQDDLIKPLAFASRYHLNPPILLNGPPPTFGYDGGDIYLKILKLAAYPNLRLYHHEKSYFWLKLSVGTACVTILAIVVFKYFKASSTK